MAPSIERSIRSAVLRDRVGGGADVAAAELDRVHDERRDLVERDALGPAVGEREDVGVRGEALRRRSRRRGASSRGRTRGGRRARRDRSASCGRRCRRGGCRPTDRRAGAPVVRPDRRTRSRRPARCSSAAIVGRRQRVGVARQLRERAAAGWSRRTRPTSRTVRSGSPRLPVVRRSSRPKLGAPARCSAASAAPSAALRRRAPAGPRRSIRARGDSAASSETASTSGTGTASAARSHARPVASVVKNSRRRGRVRLREHAPAVVEIDRVRHRDVAAVHRRVARRCSRPRLRSISRRSASSTARTLRPTCYWDGCGA